MKAPRPIVIGWDVTDHICTACNGRVLKRSRDGELVEVRCSNCGAIGEGKPESLCWCGFKMRAGSAAQRFRCVPNDHKTPEMPGEIEVREI